MAFRTWVTIIFRYVVQSQKISRAVPPARPAFESCGVKKYTFVIQGANTRVFCNTLQLVIN